MTKKTYEKLESTGGVVITPTNQTVYDYKYNGFEYQDELGLNLYDYGARNYDPAIGRWLSVDPLAEKLPFASPYAYCLNNPVVMVDPDGQYPWPFWVRSFISSSTAGGGTFRGDGRGASTSMDVTSRVNYNFTYDGQKRTMSQGAFYSDFTLKYPQVLPGGGFIPAMVKTATPHKSVDNMQNLTDRNGEALDTYGFHYWAKDPITPQLVTPALDVHGYLQLNEDLDKGVLSIWGYFKGDTFPSTEAFVIDQSGNKLFLGAHKEQGSVLTLYGDSQTPIFNFDMQVKFDDKGNFTGVIQGDKTISVENWNKDIQESFNK
jgi:RHS repeat-associated protein